MLPPSRVGRSVVFKTFALAILAVVALFACGDSLHGDVPRAVDGVIDLRGWDFDRGPLSLVGAWLFASGRLYSPAEAAAGGNFVPHNVPDRWAGAEAGGAMGQGAATYRLRLLLPPDSSDLALRFTTVSTAFSLFADGRLIGAAGRPAFDPRLAKPAYRPSVVPLPESRDGSLEILIQVSNHEYRSGGLWRPIEIGRTERLVSARFFNQAFAIGLATALAAMAVHALILFIHRPRDRSYLYFCVFALLVALRSLATGEYSIVDIFPDIPFGALIRLEYLTAYLTIPFATLFFFSVFSAEISRRLLWLLLLPHMPFAFFIPWAPLPLLTSTITYYYPIAFILIVCVGILILAKAAVRKRPGGFILLLASAIVVLAAINDMLFSSFMISSFNILPSAMALFMLLEDFVLSRRFSLAFDDIERLSEELRRSNELLSCEIEGHREARGHMELLLAEKETHLQEIHHRIKNSLQMVSSIAGLQSHRVLDETAAKALSSLRDRIRAISMVHEKLYESGVDDRLDLRDYARELLERIALGLGTDAKAGIGLECRETRVPASYCIDLGLVLAELAANAFRHGYDRDGQGSLHVAIEDAEAGFVLTVEDGGPGFPEGFSTEELSSLGFKIITSITKSRGGSCEVSTGKGGRVRVVLPMRRGERETLDPEQGSGRLAENP
ncbi:MAG TPA: 7TM diverse intracellular signaling domain-containing protein [Rectinemataceae bacterium]|nr:7TM diverse intracellular signaling domain-containing protein [Rectinemataceae bacterium]